MRKTLIEKIGYIVVCCLFILYLCNCTGREPGTFTIAGEIEGVPEGMVKVYTYAPSNILLDSCEIKDGKYFLKGKLEREEMGMLCFEVKPEYQKDFMSMVRIFLNPSDMKVFSDAKKMKATRIENNLLNDRLIACEKHFKEQPEFEKASNLSDEIQQAFLKAEMTTVRTLSRVRDSLYGVLIHRLFDWEADAARSHAVAYIANQYSAPLSGEKIMEITGRFAPDFRSSSYYVARMDEYASKEQKLKPGQLFPDFQVFDKDGRNYSLADFRGKYLFIEFSASWCGWCKKELPHVRRAYEQLKDRNIVFITMMMDTDREQWLGDIDKDRIDWLCLTDLLGMKRSPMAEACNLRGIPDSFVVDPQGYIVCRDLRGNEVLNTLSSLCR